MYSQLSFYITLKFDTYRIGHVCQPVLPLRGFIFVDDVSHKVGNALDDFPSFFLEPGQVSSLTVSMPQRQCNVGIQMVLIVEARSGSSTISVTARSPRIGKSGLISLFGILRGLVSKLQAVVGNRRGVRRRNREETRVHPEV